MVSSLEKGNERDPLWPLDFIIQAVPQSSEGSDVDIEDGWNPWEFPAIAKTLRETVSKGVAKDDSAKEVLTHMQQFTVLQRLFRLALSGELGLDFPLEKLATLQGETLSAVKIARHERWNVDSSFQLFHEAELYFLTVLQKNMNEPSIESGCRVSIENAIGRAENKPWPESTAMFEFMGEFESQCSNHSLFGSVLALRDQLREEELIDEAIYQARNNMAPKKLGSFNCSAL